MDSVLPHIVPMWEHSTGKILPSLLDMIDHFPENTTDSIMGFVKLLPLYVYRIVDS